MRYNTPVVSAPSEVTQYIKYVGFIRFTSDTGEIGKRRNIRIMYAVIKTGGKQYKVNTGDVVNVEKLPVNVGDEVVFDEVLFADTDNGIVCGKPCIEGAKVVATVVEQGKGPKVVIFKYKSKKDERKKQGHRQPFTKVQISQIVLG